MILSDLMGSTVDSADGQRLGTLIDVRFVVDGTPRQLLADARLEGIVVSPNSRASYLGYDRKDMNSPALIARFLRWRHRGTLFVLWADIEQIDVPRVRLRAQFTRYDARWSVRG
ncbi:PRC-barrel domain-containing protein [Agreia sp.]|uniref:PRC-barrel domain-containing protein n=1 Tax=Agreia sp. TaxID=1872416 RepID=UPI0035BC73DE